MRARLTAISFGLAVAAAVFVLLWPVYRGVGSGSVTHRTLIQMNGTSVIVPVTFLVLVALVRRQVVQIVAAIGFIASGQSPSFVSAADGTQFYNWSYC